MILSSILAIVIALVARILFFSVDYSRAEHLQFEDEEYYYYVKAVPKVAVSVPEKTVKKINARQEVEEEKAVKVAPKKTEPNKSHDAAKEELKKRLEQDYMIHLKLHVSYLKVRLLLRCLPLMKKLFLVKILLVRIVTFHCLNLNLECFLLMLHMALVLIVKVWV